MKPGAMLINVSRGGLVKSDALPDALESGQLGALGMDVYENEGAWCGVVWRVHHQVRVLGMKVENEGRWRG